MLRVNNLDYQYGMQHVLSSVSLQIDAGTIALLAGPNGAGKSTLLRCLAGWTRPRDGTIEINGFSLGQDERELRQQVILVPDTPDFYDELSAWEHLQFVAQLHKVNDWQGRSQALLEEFLLIDQRDAFPFTFSRGMRYKLALCMALLVNPPLLLLDEPFAPLDAASSAGVWQHLQAYRSNGKSVLFSSHIKPQAGQIDRAFLLREQQIEALVPDETNNLETLLNHA